MIMPPIVPRHPGLTVTGAKRTSEGGMDLWAIHRNIANEFVDIPLKTTPSPFDLALIEDSEDESRKKKIELSSFISISAENIGVGPLKELVTPTPTLFQFKSFSSISPILVGSQDATDIFFNIDQSKIDIDQIADGVVYRKYTKIEQVKLATVEAGAQPTDPPLVSLAEQSIPVAAHSDITYPGAQIDEAAQLRHIQGTDTTVGPMTDFIDMDGFRIKNAGEPILPDDVARLQDIQNISGHIIHWDINDEILQAAPIVEAEIVDDLIFLVETPVWQESLQYNLWEKRRIHLSDLRKSQDSAYHYDVADEFSRSPLKSGDVSNCFIIAEDGDDGFSKKEILLHGIFIPNIDTTAFHTNIYGEIFNISRKTTPITGDEVFLIEDPNAEETNRKFSLTLNDIAQKNFDENAFHWNVDDEFKQLTHLSPSAGDSIFYEQSNTGKKYKMTFGDLPTAFDAGAVHRNRGNEIWYIPEEANHTKIQNAYAIIELYGATSGERLKKKVRVANIAASTQGEVNYGINVGDGEISLYRGKSGSGLEFNTITPDDTIEFYEDSLNPGEYHLKTNPDNVKVDSANVDCGLGILRGFISGFERAAFWAASVDSIANTADCLAIWAVLGPLGTQVESLEGRVDFIGGQLDFTQLQVDNIRDDLDILSDNALQEIVPLVSAGYVPRYLLSKNGTEIRETGISINDGAPYLPNNIDFTISENALLGQRVGLIGLHDVFNSAGNWPTPDGYDAYDAYHTAIYYQAGHQYKAWFRPLLVSTQDGGGGQKRSPFKITEGKNPDQHLLRELKPSWWLENPPEIIGDGLDTTRTNSIIEPIRAGSTGIKSVKIGMLYDSEEYHAYFDRLVMKAAKFKDDNTKYYYTFIPRLVHFDAHGDVNNTHFLIYGFNRDTFEEGYHDIWQTRNLRAGPGIDISVYQQDGSLQISYSGQMILENIGTGVPIYTGVDPQTGANLLRSLKSNINNRREGIEVVGDQEGNILFGLRHGKVEGYDWQNVVEPYWINIVPGEIYANNRQFISSFYSENGELNPEIERVKFVKKRQNQQDLLYNVGLQPLVTFPFSKPLEPGGIEIFDSYVDSDDMVYQLELSNVYPGRGISITQPFINNEDISLLIENDMGNYNDIQGYNSSARVLDDTNLNYTQPAFRRLTNCKNVTNFGAINYNFITTIRSTDETYRNILLRGLYCIPQSAWSTTYGLFPMIAQKDNNLQDRFCIRSLSFRWGAPWTDVYDTLRGRNQVTRFVDVSNWTNNRFPQREVMLAIPTVKNMKRYFNDIKHLIPEKEKFKSSETTHSVFWGTYFTDENEPAESSTILFREIDIRNHTSDEILNFSVDSNFFADDTLTIGLDPYQIKRLGIQAVDLDMGTYRIKNVANPQDPNDVVPLSMYTELAQRIAALELIAHPKDHDDGSDPFDEDFDLGGDETSWREDAIPGDIIPHKVINMKDADLNVLTDGVNVGTLKNYINNFVEQFHIIKLKNSVDGNVVTLDNGAFGKFFLINPDINDMTILLPEITPTNKGKIIYFKYESDDLINNQPYNVTLGINGPFGCKINKLKSFFDITNSHNVISIMSDGDKNWILFSSSLLSGSPKIELGNQQLIPEYADNSAAIADGMKSGIVYRTGDNLKIVH